MTEQKPLIEYPTVYSFKVMGRRNDGFEQFIRELFARVFGELTSDSIAENVSAQGTYVSLTVSVQLHTEDQRQTIYAALHGERHRILYYL